MKITPLAFSRRRQNMGVHIHTTGTMLNDTGADVNTIQIILGQSDFKTMIDRYVHPRDDRKQEAIKNVSLLLQNGG